MNRRKFFGSLASLAAVPALTSIPVLATVPTPVEYEPAMVPPNLLQMINEDWNTRVLLKTHEGCANLSQKYALIMQDALDHRRYHNGLLRKFNPRMVGNYSTVTTVRIGPGLSQGIHDVVQNQINEIDDTEAEQALTSEASYAMVPDLISVVVSISCNYIQIRFEQTYSPAKSSLIFHPSIVRA